MSRFIGLVSLADNNLKKPSNHTVFVHADEIVAICPLNVRQGFAFASRVVLKNTEIVDVGEHSESVMSKVLNLEHDQ